MSDFTDYQFLETLELEILYNKIPQETTALGLVKKFLYDLGGQNLEDDQNRRGYFEYPLAYPLFVTTAAFIGREVFSKLNPDFILPEATTPEQVYRDLAKKMVARPDFVYQWSHRTKLLTSIVKTERPDLFEKLWWLQ